MKVAYVGVQDFEFWGGAKDFVAKLTEDELRLLDDYLEDEQFGTMTEINDFFWFEQDLIADWLETTVDEIIDRE